MAMTIQDQIARTLAHLKAVPVPQAEETRKRLAVDDLERSLLLVRDTRMGLAGGIRTGGTPAPLGGG